MSVLLLQSRPLPQIHGVAEVFVPAGCPFNPVVDELFARGVRFGHELAIVASLVLVGIALV